MLMINHETKPSVNEHEGRFLFIYEVETKPSRPSLASMKRPPGCIISPMILSGSLMSLSITCTLLPSCYLLVGFYSIIHAELGKRKKEYIDINLGLD